MKTRCLLTFSLLVLAAACVSVKYAGGIEPVDPVPSGQTGFAKATSLRPTLKWRASEPGASTGLAYDLVIYEGVLTSLQTGTGETPGSVIRPGKEVYYREGLAGTSHTVEKQLLPYCYYCWTVRTRTGTNLSPWVTWSRQKLLGSEEGIYWAFKTPGLGSP